MAFVDATKAWCQVRYQACPEYALAEGIPGECPVFGDVLRVVAGKAIRCFRRPARWFWSSHCFAICCGRANERVGEPHRTLAKPAHHIAAGHLAVMRAPHHAWTHL
jgi:hypothetical protein